MQLSSKGGVIIAGQATRDAEYKHVGAKDTPMCTFGLAVGRDAENKPIYANVKAWRDLAEYAAGVTKGASVMVLGQVEEREYEGKVYKAVVADFLVYLDLKPPAVGDPAGFTPVPDDDLPF